MIETLSFLFGLGFSVLVYVRTIRTGSYRPVQKMMYALLSTIGITGMVWLCGVIIAHFLRKMNVLP